MVCLLTGSGPPPQTEGHKKMVSLLSHIKARSRDENIWLGDREVRIKRRQLKELGPFATSDSRWRGNFEVGMLELRLGNEAQAIEHLRKSYELLPDVVHRLPKGWDNHNLFELGVAYLRMGETQNCCLRNNPESCILPIRNAGLHIDETGSRKAIEMFTELLSRPSIESNMQYKTQWLLNIAYMTVGGYPHDVPTAHRIPPKVFESEQPFAQFENIAMRVGLDSFNLYGSAVIDDFNGDGYLDVFTTTFDPNDRIHLFWNDQDGFFSDGSVQAGLADLYGGINAVQADYDNDGDIDLYVLRGAWMADGGRHPNSLIRNNGDRTFTDVTFEAGLGEVHYPTQTAAWADYDNDGDIDLYVGNEHSKGFAKKLYSGTEGSQRIEAPSQLFRNNGDGTFSDVAAEAGVENFRFVKGVVWGDYNNDRWPDLYTSSLGEPNRLYHNNGDGTFSDIAPLLGVTEPLASFPVWFWDFDNDGALDLYVPSYQGTKDAIGAVAATYLGLRVSIEMPRLYRGNGKYGFEEVAAARNLTKFLLPMGANFGDLDNDGYLDFYLGTGYPDYEALSPNVMYRNVNGESFADITTASGLGHLQKGHAIAFADLDNDGDQDVFEQMGGILPGDRYNDALFENPGFDNHWIAIRLVGTSSNRSAIGASIHIFVEQGDGNRSIYRHVNSGGSFGSNPLRQNIGLGQASGINRLEIKWPTSGLTQTFEDVPMDCFVQIVEGDDQLSTFELRKLQLGRLPEAAAQAKDVDTRLR
ncbi:MAG: hypothetical protein DF168_01669 [Candidatus Moanabacter tarae]|uniref:ASPIC/UnbV domain-containing protein n=1 Tax=Candidatus Moanibacter tarae TaxID=2200854 RepID=A0A2Z4AFU7_9BACT|nr:MAG: hypothetical protein DF168_01669 [Candidatus Moanabacter tarae]|tara:strand:- start:27943 stop:30201 length:2259 start_codon:yes stop_codon:yes gene_type:complete